MALQLPPEYPELIASAAIAAHRALVEAKIVPETAARIAFEVAEAIRHDLGGTMQYVPKGCLFDLLGRDLEIAQKRARGVPYDVLAREYDLSEMRIRQIEAVWLAAERARRQLGLFE